MAGERLFKLSLTTSNWSVDRAISVSALSSDKGQSPFAAQAAEKVHELCVCVCAPAREEERGRSPEEKVDS